MKEGRRMKKNIKTVSYIFVLGALLSSVQPVVAQTNRLKRARIREAAQQAQRQTYGAAQKFQERAVEAINNLEARIKNLLTQLDEYRQCIISKEGCSPEQKATLKKAGWAIGAGVTALLLLFLMEWQERRSKKEVREVPVVVAEVHRIFFGHRPGERPE